MSRLLRLRPARTEFTAVMERQLDEARAFNARLRGVDLVREPPPAPSLLVRPGPSATDQALLRGLAMAAGEGNGDGVISLRAPTLAQVQAQEAARVRRRGGVPLDELALVRDDDVIRIWEPSEGTTRNPDAPSPWHMVTMDSLHAISDQMAALHREQQRDWQECYRLTGLQVEHMLTIASTPWTPDDAITRALSKVYEATLLPEYLYSFNPGLRAGKTTLTTARLFEPDDDLEPPPDPLLVAEACDPTTPHARLVWLGERHSELNDLALRNPNLDTAFLRDAFLDGWLPTWLNPSLPLALYEVDPDDLRAVAINACETLSYRWRAPAGLYPHHAPGEGDVALRRWQALVHLVGRTFDALPPRQSAETLQRDREVLAAIGRVMGWAGA